jgi:hypothetical protein
MLFSLFNTDLSLHNTPLLISLPIQVFYATHTFHLSLIFVVRARITFKSEYFEGFRDGVSGRVAAQSS